MSVLRRVRSRVSGLLPYRVRRGLRALVEAPIADPKDVATVAIQWSPNLPATLGDLGLPFTRQPVPAALQSNGARDLLVVSL